MTKRFRNSPSATVTTVLLKPVLAFVMVTLAPATGLLLLEVTRYLVAAPATVAMLLVVPVRLPVSVPVTV